MLYDGLFWNVPGDFEGPGLTTEMVAVAESALGYRLPESYINILKIRNGGMLKRDFFRREVDGRERTFWIYVLLGVGWNEGIDYAKNGETLNQRLIRGRYYPDTGVVFCHMADAGYMLDYSLCGPEGAPRVIYKCESEYGGVRLIPLAPDFETFVAGLYRGSVSLELEDILGPLEVKEPT